MDTFVPFAFVAAVGGVDLEDVAVSGFQLFQDATFVDNSGAAVIGKCAEENRILAVVFVERNEFGEVFSEECVCLCLCELDTSAIWLTRLDLMPVPDVWPMLRLVHCFKLLYDEDGSLKERQFHYTSFCGESRRSNRYGHYRHKNHEYFLHRHYD